MYTEKLKKPLRIIIAGLCLLVVLLLFFMVFITSSPGEKLIGSIIRKKLTFPDGFTLSIEEVETNLFSRFQVKHIAIDYPDGSVFLNIKHGIIHYCIFDFLKSNYTLQSLHLDSIHLAIKRNSTGRILLSSSTQNQDSNKKDTPPLQILIKNINIINSRITYQDKKIPLNGTLREIKIKWSQQENKNFSFRFSSDSGKIEYQNQEYFLGQTNITGNICPDYWQIHDLKTRCAGLVCTGKAEGKINPLSNFQGTLSVQGPIQDLSVLLPPSLAPTLTPITGRMSAFIQLRSNKSTTNYQSTVELSDIRLGYNPAFQASLRAEGKDSLITVENLNITSSTGQISGKGFLVMDSLLNHHLSLSITDIQLTNLNNIIFQDPADPEGKIHGHLISSGPVHSLKDLYLDSQLNLTHIRYKNTKLPDISIKLSAQSGSASLIVGQDENGLKSQWRLYREKIKGEYTFDIPRLETIAALLPLSDLKGSLYADGKIQGSVYDPVITTEIQGKAITYHAFPLDSLTASIVYRKRKIHIENAKFSGRSLSEDSTKNLFPEIDLMSGFSYQGSISGPLSNPQGSLHAVLTNPKYKNLTWDQGELKLTLAEKQVRLDPLILCKDSLFFHTSGKYDIPSFAGYLKISAWGQSISSDSLFSIDHQIDPPSELFSAGSVRADFQHDPSQGWQIQAEGEKILLKKILSVYEKRIQGKGTINFILTASGNDQDLSGKLDFQIYSLGRDQSALDSLKGTVTVKENSLILHPFDLYTRGNTSQVEAYVELIKQPNKGYTLNQESNIRGHAQGENIDLQFIPPLLGLDIQVSGISSYSLQWEGKWGKPKLRGHLRVEEGTVKLDPDKKTIRSMEVNISLLDSLLLINPITGIIENMPFRMEGWITGARNQRFQANLQLKTDNVETFTLQGGGTPDTLNIQASINNLTLYPLKEFISGVHQLDGSLNGQMLLSGSVRNPRINGFLNATNMTLQPHFLDTPFTRGFIEMTFENNSISLDSLSFTKDKGTMTARGNTRYSKKMIRDLKILIKAKGVKMHRAQELKLTIKNMDIQVNKIKDGYSIGGDIILGESTYLRNIRPKAVISFFQKVERPLSTPPQLLQNTQLHVRVRESNKLWINNNIARLRLHPELTFIGTLASPNLTGRMSVEEGYILYLDHKFEVEHGILDFVDPYHINPQLDFKARAEIKNYQTVSGQQYTVLLGIQGPLDQADITLTSNPFLEKSDIITVLTVGATRKELTGSDKSGKSSIGTVLEERLGQISSRQLTDFASREIGDVFGLKDMSIKGNLFRFGKSWGPRLVASKTITDRMKISYSTRVGHSNEQSIRLNYKLSKNLSIESQTDQKGKAGIDLKFNWKFK
ncbi:MAG: translocation/assembly module TamB domain-containing protein [bacterium]